MSFRFAAKSLSRWPAPSQGAPRADHLSRARPPWRRCRRSSGQCLRQPGSTWGVCHRGQTRALARAQAWFTMLRARPRQAVPARPGAPPRFGCSCRLEKRQARRRMRPPGDEPALEMGETPASMSCRGFGCLPDRSPSDNHSFTPATWARTRPWANIRAATLPRSACHRGHAVGCD